MTKLHQQKPHGPGTAVAPVPPTPEQLPAEIAARMREDAAQDSVQFEREDMAIPFLRLAQDLTPQTKKHEPTFVPGLEPGDFFHTVTGEIWKGDEGVFLMPVAFSRSFTEWGLRETGGGFKRDWANDGSVLERCTRDDKNRDITPEGTQIVSAALYYVLLVDPATGSHQPAALSLSGSQRKHAKRWNALIAQFKARGIPSYGKSYRLTSVVEKNQQGTWYVVHFEPATLTLALPNGAALYEAAKEYATMVGSGVVRVEHEKATETETEGSENVPF